METNCIRTCFTVTPFGCHLRFKTSNFGDKPINVHCSIFYFSHGQPFPPQPFYVKISSTLIDHKERFFCIVTYLLIEVEETLRTINVVEWCETCDFPVYVLWVDPESPRDDMNSQ